MCKNMGDVIDLRKVSDSANGMGEQAEVIKAKKKPLIERFLSLSDDRFKSLSGIEKGPVSRSFYFASITSRAGFRQPTSDTDPRR